MKDTAYYKSVLESLELGCEVEWNEIHWYNYWSSSGQQNWAQRYGIHLPNKLGLGNLHDSLYVEYWGWEYGLPEKSPPERKHKNKKQSMFRNSRGWRAWSCRFLLLCPWEIGALNSLSHQPLLRTIKSKFKGNFCAHTQPNLSHSVCRCFKWQMTSVVI